MADIDTEDKELAQCSVALMRVNYQGVPRVVIVRMMTHGDVVDVVPLAMMLNEEMFRNINPLPGGIEVRA
jgi:hypothetical protein